MARTLSSDRVEIVEVGPRDGLQNEAALVKTADKISLVDQLSGTGLRRIEVSSFVSPKWVPQLADAAEVFGGIARNPDVRYGALVPNLKGYTAARAANAGEVAIFASASEGFSLKNINCTIAESFERFAPILEAAKADKMPVRGYISCVIACPYDGPTDPRQVAAVAEKLLEMSCYEISLGDTIGVGQPEDVTSLLAEIRRVGALNRFAGHFHDTNGRALDNISAALDAGIRIFDASVAGLGGCPYAPGASGNVATGAVLDLLLQRGIETGVDRAAIANIERWVTTHLVTRAPNMD